MADESALQPAAVPPSRGRFPAASSCCWPRPAPVVTIGGMKLSSAVLGLVFLALTLTIAVQPIQVAA
ncbi:hypothetical protein BTZ20_3797 [Rhodococcus sp. MTM3W5.2]|nr:hypothetical protein BTZ20_3797 [Rhodococcus sp. MTM3W5.2]